MAQSANEDTPGERLRQLLQARWKGKDKEFAALVGIDPVTLSRLVNDVSDLRKSPNLAAIASALGVGEGELVYGPLIPHLPRAIEADHVSEDRPEYGTPSQSAAEQLIELLNLRAGTRRVAGELTARGKSLLTVAYTIALDDHWPVEEIRKIDALRDSILEEEETGGG